MIRAVEKIKNAQYSALLDRKRLMELRGASDEELRELHLEIDKLVGTLMEPRAESQVALHPINDYRLLSRGC